MATNFARLALVGLVLACSSLGSGLAGDQETSTPGLRATQITLLIPENDGSGKGRKFRATVMARKDNLLTVLTAAHCVLADDVNGPARLLLDRGEAINGTVALVVRNPAYKPNPTREIPGADNALARFRFKPTSATATEAFESLKPAIGLTSRPYPAPSGGTVIVRMIDQYDVEHAVKAGNYSNPRLLEWGLSYKPVHGDSGSGVFAMSRGVEGQQPRPILIGIVSSNDAKGGMASLISKEMRWIADELAR